MRNLLRYAYVRYPGIINSINHVEAKPPPRQPIRREPATERHRGRTVGKADGKWHALQVNTRETLVKDHPQSARPAKTFFAHLRYIPTVHI
jgi:hypothetical protein